MPNEEQLLSASDKALVQAWLKERVRTGACSSCGENRWEVAEHLLAAPVFSDGNIFIGGVSYPMVMLVCQSCGFARFYSAVKLGVVPPSEGNKHVK